MTCDLLIVWRKTMRLLGLLFAGLLTINTLHGEWYWDGNTFIQECSGGQADLIPILRVGVIPRFLDDTAAISLLGEYGRDQNRVNATFGFPLWPGNSFKLGGEMLNQQLSYRFPYDHNKAWVRQYAAGGAYQMNLNFWGLKTLEIQGQWSKAQGHKIHRLHHHDRFGQRYSNNGLRGVSFHRSVSGSEAYAISGGLTIAPWFWSSLSASVVYDHVRYVKRRVKNHEVSGVGGNVYFQQRLSPSVTLSFIGQFRSPYNYYEGNIWWRTKLAGTDVIIGGFGGHTQGRKGLPSSTVAGIEIGFDFGLKGFSNSCSIGICDDSPEYYCQSAPKEVGREYLEWIALPAVYVPQVLSVAEQHVVLYPRMQGP